jgi:hypothetical protein
MDVLAVVVLATIGPAFPLAVWWRSRGEPDDIPGLKLMHAIAPVGDVAAIALAIVVLL